MDDLEEKLQPTRDYLLDTIARSEANIIDKLPQIREANDAYRELAKGVLALNGAGVAGATTLLTVTDFPKQAVGISAAVYLTSLLLTLVATALEIGRPFLQIYIARVGLDHSREALENLTKPISMDQAFEMAEINDRIARRMLLGRPWNWAVKYAPWLTALAAAGFLWASLALIISGWSITGGHSASP